VSPVNMHVFEGSADGYVGASERGHKLGDTCDMADKEVMLRAADVI